MYIGGAGVAAAAESVSDECTVVGEGWGWAKWVTDDVCSDACGCNWLLITLFAFSLR